MSIFKCSGRNGYLHGEFTGVFPFLKECHMASSFIRINCEASLRRWSPVDIQTVLSNSVWQSPLKSPSVSCPSTLPRTQFLPLLLLFCSSDQFCNFSCVLSLSYLRFWERQCVFQCHAEKWRYEQSLAYPMTGHQYDTAELDHAVTDCILLPLGLAFAIVYSPRSPSVPQDTFLLSSQCGHAQRNSFSVLNHFHPSVF